jgi:hypothetical protein
MTDDPLIVFDRNKERTDALRNMLINTRAAFIVCGGPSANKLPLEALNQRGIWSIAVNNMAAHFRPQAFVCSDPPSKFHDAIWTDPCVMKILPAPKISNGGKGHLRQKVDGKFQRLRHDGKLIKTAGCPNVWGFARRGWWAYDDTFFTDDHATWGNQNAGVLRTSNPKVMCTMLLPIRLLHYMGIRRIFLVGVDFNMSADSPYAFDQSKGNNGLISNNSQYRVVNDGLCKMVENGVFKNFGMEIFNCCQTSGLRAFPYVHFQAAVDDTLKNFPKEIDLKDWYFKGEKRAANPVAGG